ncbi:MAG: Uma2 family endonuclease [Pyrinomonadaceae bacterium]
MLEQIGESRGVRTSYCDGTLQIMVVSSEHEKYAWFIGQPSRHHQSSPAHQHPLLRRADDEKEKRRKGLEPDACFYVQSAPLIGNRMQLDFTTDPPPDIAVEIDIHHGSISKFPIYAALGVARSLALRWRAINYSSARTEMLMCPSKRASVAAC